MYHGTECRNQYLKEFVDPLPVRKLCVYCRYPKANRVSDIALGDFNGLGKIISLRLKVMVVFY